MAANDLSIGQTITLATGESGRITRYDADRDEWRVTIYHAEGTPLAGLPETQRRLRTREVLDLMPATGRIPTGQKCSYWTPNGTRICVRVDGPGEAMEPGWQPCKILTRGRSDYRYGTVVTLDSVRLVPRDW